MNYQKREYYNEWIGDPPPEEASPLSHYWLETSYTFGGILAAAVKNRSGNLAWDIVGSWSNEQLHYFDTDPAVLNFVGYSVPLYIEQTLSWTPNDGNTFIALKQANDIYLNRDLYYGRIMPCVEHWFMKLFALRLGAEGAVTMREDEAVIGWGGTAGATVRVWKLDIDANYTFRMRPSRTLTDVIIPENVFFITVAMNGLLKN